LGYFPDVEKHAADAVIGARDHELARRRRAEPKAEPGKTLDRR
jgi:hypothetical protein